MSDLPETPQDFANDKATASESNAIPQEGASTVSSQWVPPLQPAAGQHPANYPAAGQHPVNYPAAGQPPVSCPASYPPYPYSPQQMPPAPPSPYPQPYRTPYPHQYMQQYQQYPVHPPYQAVQPPVYPPYQQPVFYPAYYQSVSPPRPGEGLAIASLVVGLITLTLFWIPVLNIIMSITALILGIIAKSKGNGGIAIAGIIIGSIILLLSVLCFIFIIVMINMDTSYNEWETARLLLKQFILFSH